ncbi:MAG: chromophore lyase CpcT/CpeT [Hyphomonadaceae bacterium]|nr:chromophore lyase CpcT/CpeT [Hyphomonadaceae bacterium]MBC6412932.1 chromophore lyase CpcT/CpeT [Hyphomonadaceae bacterium]
MKKLLSFCFTAPLLFGATQAPAQELQPPESAADRILKRDFARFLNWFPGRYDNMEQVYFNENLGVPEHERHGRIHHIFAPVDLPAFPGETFYVEQYADDDPDNIYRQRIYSFEPDFDENAIRLTIYVPGNTAALKGAHADASKLDGLTPSDFTVYPGCEVYWRYQNEHFHGTMKPGACRVESRRSGRMLVITDDLQLSRSSIWIRDEAEDTDGNYVYGNKARIHHKSNRARMFNCWVSPQKHDGEYGFYNNIGIHDQGGKVWLESDDHQTVGIRMRNVVWPMGNNRNSLVLYAHRGDDPERPVSYTWTAPDSGRIALNLRWLQASCTLGDTTVIPGINLKTGNGD